MASFTMADQILVVPPSSVPSMDIKDYVYAVPTAQQQSAAVLQLAQAMFTAFSCQHPFSAWGLNGGTFSMNASQVPSAALQAHANIHSAKMLKAPTMEAVDAASLTSRKPRTTPAASSAKLASAGTKSPTSSSSGASTDTKEQPAPTRRGRSGSVLRQQLEQPPAVESTPHELLSHDFELHPDAIRQMLEQGDSFLQQDAECASSISKNSATGIVTRPRISIQPSPSLPFLTGGGGLSRPVGVPTAPRTYTHKRKLSTILTDSAMDIDDLTAHDVLLCGQSSAPLPSTLSSFRHPGCVGAAVSARLSWSPPSTSEDDSAHYSKETQLASLTADDLLLLAMLQPSSHASGEFGNTYDHCGRDDVERKTAAMCGDAITTDHDIGGKTNLFVSGFQSRSRMDSMESGSMDSCMSGPEDFLSTGFALTTQGSGSLSYTDAHDCFSMEEDCFLPLSTAAKGQIAQQFTSKAAPLVPSCALLQSKAASGLTAAMLPARQFHSTSGAMKGLASFNALDALTDMMQDEDSTCNSNSSWGMGFNGLMEFDASDLFADL